MSEMPRDIQENAQKPFCASASEKRGMYRMPCPAFIFPQKSIDRSHHQALLWLSPRGFAG
jgi:hypothetical protein